MHSILTSVTFALIISSISAFFAYGENGDGKKHRDEQEEQLRKAEPKKDYEIALIKSNDRLIAMIDKAERMELLRLDPKSVDVTLERREDVFHEYKIITRVPITLAKQRMDLSTSLGKELHWLEAWKDSCFNPRHGLRIVKGDNVTDMVLCFECGRMKIYSEKDKLNNESVLVGSKWEVADKILNDAEKKP